MITFNNVELTNYAICGDPEIHLFQYTPELRETSGNGSLFIGKRIAAGEVTIKCAIAGDATTRRTSLSNLAKVLNVDEPKKLVLPDSPSWYYLAVPSSGLSLERHIDGELFDLTFSLVDPVAYGTERTVTVPSGGSVTFTVDGTSSAYPYITSTATRNSTSLVWGLSLDSTEHVHIETGSSSSRSIVLDCLNRTLTVAGAAKIPTLDSDWLELSPGSHTLTMDNGTGSATVKYRERWL